MNQFYYLVHFKQYTSVKMFGELSVDKNRFRPKGYKSHWDLGGGGYTCFENNADALESIANRILDQIEKLRLTFPATHSSIQKKMKIFNEVQRKIKRL